MFATAHTNEREVSAWKEVTTIADTKQALVLVLASDKKAEFLENMEVAALKTATGVDTFLKYLKDNYGQDELSVWIDTSVSESIKDQLIKPLVSIVQGLSSSIIG